MTFEHFLIVCLLLVFQTISIETQDAASDGDELSVLPVLDPKEVWIDAFDEKICGAAEFRPWQASQSAFGCSNDLKRVALYSSSNGSGLDGHTNVEMPSEAAHQGEFPFHVLIKIYGTKTEAGRLVHYTRECSGLLVDRSLVITLDLCFYDYGIETSRIKTVELVFGMNSVGLSNSTRNEPVTRRAKRWCKQEYGFWESSHLAAIELGRPVEYVKNRIWPACLRTSQDQLLNDTVCASAVLCPGEPLKSVPSKSFMLEEIDSFYPDMYRKLDSRLILDQCHRGAPIVCYDRCLKDENQIWGLHSLRKRDRGRVQAFVVGIHMDYKYDKNATLGRAINFERYRREFFDLLLVVQTGEKRHMNANCYVPDY